MSRQCPSGHLGLSPSGGAPLPTPGAGAATERTHGSARQLLLVEPGTEHPPVLFNLLSKIAKDGLGTRVARLFCLFL